MVEAKHWNKGCVGVLLFKISEADFMDSVLVLKFGEEVNQILLQVTMAVDEYEQRTPSHATLDTAERHRRHQIYQRDMSHNAAKENTFNNSKESFYERRLFGRFSK